MSNDSRERQTEDEEAHDRVGAAIGNTPHWIGNPEEIGLFYSRLGREVFIRATAMTNQELASIIMGVWLWLDDEDRADVAGMMLALVKDSSAGVDALAQSIATAAVQFSGDLDKDRIAEMIAAEHQE